MPSLFIPQSAVSTQSTAQTETPSLRAAHWNVTPPVVVDRFRLPGTTPFQNPGARLGSDRSGEPGTARASNMLRGRSIRRVLCGAMVQMGKSPGTPRISRMGPWQATLATPPLPLSKQASPLAPCFQERCRSLPPLHSSEHYLRISVALDATVQYQKTPRYRSTSP